MEAKSADTKTVEYTVSAPQWVTTSTQTPEFKSFYKTVGGNEGNKCNYPTRLDLYGCGCFHDCSYCYAKSLLSFRGLWHPNNPSVSRTDKVERKISRLEKGTVVRLGGMTDCFQPCEAIYRETYKAIQNLNQQGIHYLIVTKASMVADDMYMKVMDTELAHIQISVTSTDDKLSRTFEKACLPSVRIKAIEKLQRQGFDVSLRLSPFIPQFIDFDILNSVKCDKILVEFLRVNTWVKQWFNIDMTEYTLKHTGYNHLPLKRKIEYLSKISGFKEISVCEDVDDHFQYWKKNVNYNSTDCCNLNIVHKTI